jgi:hypothetical protein
MAAFAKSWRRNDGNQKKLKIGDQQAVIFLAVGTNKFSQPAALSTEIRVAPNSNRFLLENPWPIARRIKVLLGS